MHAAARLPRERLRREVRREAVARGDGLYRRTEGERIIRGGNGVGIAEVYLILSGALLMVGAFRLDAHLLKH